jgi:hypothetical protein
MSLHVQIRQDVSDAVPVSSHARMAKAVIVRNVLEGRLNESGAFAAARGIMTNHACAGRQARAVIDRGKGTACALPVQRGLLLEGEKAWKVHGSR